ncbi:MAG TPA: OmpA family protein [Terriglobales bacterium]|nr:OmpA family protein [Terriglobales bacterium]
MLRETLVTLVTCGCLILPAHSQVQVQPSHPPPAADKIPVYRVTVVGRTTKAINYRHRGGSTTIDFRGTPLLPDGRGEAKVESKQGYIEIEVEFDDLAPATRFGPEYLTYVLWAITPEGRATNLGEVLLNGTKSKLNVTTELQAFGLVVTAEPHFAVTQPSDVVVLENVVRRGTKGQIQEIDARYELLQRGQYTANVSPDELRPLELDKKTPLELYEARNALRVARWAGAQQYAGETYQKAEQLLSTAEGYHQQGAKKRTIIMAAREAAQTAEDARLVAVRKQQEVQQAALVDREAAAQAEAEAEAERRAQVQLEADAAKRAREEAERERRQAELAAHRAEREKQEAEQEKLELRGAIIDQLNRILDTRETVRGLVVNMPDLLFQSGSHTLRPAAREKLAKVAGIILAHPGLRLEVEGHTDSVGTEEFNQRLSERRAAAVRDFLVQQGVPSSAIGSLGFGESHPIASNDTSIGRQQNRRVELVVSGDVIGIPIEAASATRPR